MAVDKITVYAGSDGRVHCECGEEMTAYVREDHSGIPVYVGSEDSGSPYDIGEWTADLDTWSSKHISYELRWIACERCRKFYDPTKTEVILEERDVRVVHE